jgi:Holliday junction resolvasome RuvABC endonuclease subunit
VKTQVWLGIDPGQSGSIACIFESGNVTWIKLSETNHDVSEWVRDIVQRHRVAATIENVHSMPKQGVSSSFKFGMSFGFLQGLLVAHQVPFQFATPQKWQSAMQCRTGGDKNISKAAAQRLWPKTKITHTNADAMLIAEYCRRVNS